MVNGNFYDYWDIYDIVDTYNKLDLYEYQDTIISYLYYKHLIPHNTLKCVNLYLQNVNLEAMEFDKIISDTVTLLDYQFNGNTYKIDNLHELKNCSGTVKFVGTSDKYEIIINGGDIICLDISEYNFTHDDYIIEVNSSFKNIKIHQNQLSHIIITNNYL